MHRPLLISAGAAAGLMLAVAAPVIAEDPARTLAALEARLLQAEIVRVEFVVSSEGILQSRLEGGLEINGDVISLEAEGDFGGSPADLVFAAAGAEMTGGNLALADPSLREFSAATPAAVEEAVVLGLTRMGVLHNLARLVGAQPPDRGEGGIREWLHAGNVSEATDGTLSFDVIVSGQKSGKARLALDERDLPRRREQIVSFPAGDMKVVEEYRVFEVLKTARNP